MSILNYIRETCVLRYMKAQQSHKSNLTYISQISWWFKSDPCLAAPLKRFKYLARMARSCIALFILEINTFASLSSKNKKRNIYLHTLDPSKIRSVVRNTPIGQKRVAMMKPSPLYECIIFSDSFIISNNLKYHLLYIILHI